VNVVPDAIAYGRMRWNTPLSEDHAELLLERLEVSAGDEVVDLGCGWGELLIRAVVPVPTCRGTGVDNAPWALERGRNLAAEQGVSDRVAFVAEDASTWPDSADRIVCIGASQAWGSEPDALRNLRRAVRPGGRLLFGDGCWEHPPSADAAAMFGESVLALSDLVNAAMQAGWHVLHVSTADQREWDDFEATWRAGREDWLLAHPGDPRAGEVRTHLAGRLREYVNVYRGVLGFAYLVLS
jgi:cyclopropane fatty-acyl-phospholipid synthase-like methyltransferase